MTFCYRSLQEPLISPGGRPGGAPLGAADGRCKGAVLRYDEEKGFGFLKPENGSEEREAGNWICPKRVAGLEVV